MCVGRSPRYPRCFYRPRSGKTTDSQPAGSKAEQKRNTTMKNRISITIGTLAFVSLCVASLGYAQSLTMKAQVPFAFVAGKTQLPAGEYSIYRLLSSSVTLRDD